MVELFNLTGDKMATCPDCGSVIMEGDPYCSHCGAHLVWDNDDDEIRCEENYLDTNDMGVIQSAAICLYWDNVTSAREIKKMNGNYAAIITHYEKAVNFNREYWDNVSLCGKREFKKDVFYHIEDYASVQRFRRYGVEFFMPDSPLLTEDLAILDDIYDFYMLFGSKAMRERVEKLKRSALS